MSRDAQPTLATVLESFFRMRLVAQRGASAATISTYRDALRLLVLFAATRTKKPPARLGFADLDRDLILAFLDHLETERRNGPRTRNARLAVIRSFFEHVAGCDPASMGIAERVRSIPWKRTVSKVLGYLRRDELAAVLAASDQSHRQGRRDYALLLFLSRVGARVSEAVGVNATDLHLDRPWQVRIRGKGSKERVVPLAEDCVAVLRTHCEEEGIALDQAVAVFRSARGSRLTRHAVTHIVRRTVARAAKAKPDLATRSITPHTFRHTLAMHLLQAGVDLTTIRSWLGHVHVDTTHHYVEADVEMKRRALEKVGGNDAALARYAPRDEVLALLERSPSPESRIPCDAPFPDESSCSTSPR